MDVDRGEVNWMDGDGERGKATKKLMCWGVVLFVENLYLRLYSPLNVV